MLKNSLALMGLLVVGGMASPTVGFAANDCPEMKTLNPDYDGTIDMNEATTAAKALFKVINPDNDGTLDEKEVKGRLTKEEFQAANPDKDGTLDEAEFLKVVEQRFAKANPDNDGTIDCKELGTPAGKALLSVLQK